MENSRPIGVYDSGLGGLTVVRELWRQVPCEPVAYFGDTARVPYGGRPQEEIIAFSREIIGFLIELGCRLIIAACNTSSALALPVVAAEAPVPVMGVLEAGAEEAAASTTNKRVGVLATEGTVRSKAYSRAIKARLPDATVFEQPCPTLVPLIEAGLGHSSEARAMLETYAGPLVEQGVDTVILGCTHYPLIQDEIALVLPRDVKIIDPAVRTVEEAARFLEIGVQAGKCSPEEVASARGKDRFFVSGEPQRFRDAAVLALGSALPPVCRHYPSTWTGVKSGEA